MNSEPRIQVEQSEGVATLWLNRPEVRNALDSRLIEELGAALARLETDDSVRVVLLRGRGLGFCAGADLKELAALKPPAAGDWQRRATPVFDRLAEAPFPVVAVLHGFALGGGFFLSLYCDLRIVQQGTKLGFPPVARQWIPPWALTRLAAWVGTRRAEQLLLCADVFDPEQAEHWGLADLVVDGEKLEATVQNTAARLAGSQRHVVREIRQFFSKLHTTEHAQWDQESIAGFQRSFAREEVLEGLNKFRERSGQDLPQTEQSPQ